MIKKLPFLFILMVLPSFVAGQPVARAKFTTLPKPSAAQVLRTANWIARQPALGVWGSSSRIDAHTGADSLATIVAAMESLAVDENDTTRGAEVMAKASLIALEQGLLLIQRLQGQEEEIRDAALEGFIETHGQMLSAIDMLKIRGSGVINGAHAVARALTPDVKDPGAVHNISFDEPVTLGLTRHVPMPGTTMSESIHAPVAPNTPEKIGGWATFGLGVATIAGAPIALMALLNLPGPLALISGVVLFFASRGLISSGALAQRFSTGGASRAIGAPTAHDPRSSLNVWTWLFTSLGLGAIGMILAATTMMQVVGLPLAIALGLGAGTVLLARHFQSTYPMQSGQFATISVALAPTAAYFLMQLLGLAPDRTILSDSAFNVRLVLELITIAAAAIGAYSVRFAFLAMPAAAALWVAAFDLSSRLYPNGGQYWGQSMEHWVSLGVGGVVLAISRVLDGNAKADFSKWLYLSGLASVWGSLTTMAPHNEWLPLGYFALNLGLVAIGQAIKRTSFRVFGTVGAILYLGRELVKFFDTPIFVGFGLLAIAIGGIWLVVIQQKAKEAGTTIGLSESVAQMLRQIRSLLP